MKQNRIELVAVINSFNRRELLEKAIASLTFALRKAPFHSAIVVFEAGSTDGSAEFLNNWRDQNPEDNLAVVTAPPQTSSFADGANAGCATAIARFPDCRWLFLYETDNWLADVDPLINAISLLEAQPQLAAAGFTVRLHNGQPCGYGIRFPSRLSLVMGQNLSLHWNLNSPNDSPWQMTDNIRWRTCDVVFTSPLVIRRLVWEKTGGFDAKSFPFSDSDVDWAWRCAEAGWKMAVLETNAVIHDNLRQASPWSATRVIDFHRGRLRVLRSHRRSLYVLIKPALFLRHCAETIVLAWKTRSDPSARQKLASRKQMLQTVWTDYSGRPRS